MMRKISALALTTLLAAGAVATSPGASAADDRRDLGALQDFRASVGKSGASARTAKAAAPVIGTCYLTVPATVRVVTPYREITVSVRSGCAIQGNPYAAWYIGPDYDAPDDFIFFEGSNTSQWLLFGDTPLGTRTWLPDGAFKDYEGTAEYTQNSPKTVAKVGSFAKLSTTRSGNTVTINTSATRYATTLERNVPWVSATTTIQFRPSGSATWRSIKTSTTNSAGAASYRWTNSQRGDYRAIYSEVPTIWGVTSPSSTR